MHMGFRFVAVVVYAVIAGCAGGKSAPPDLALVTVSVLGPDFSGQHAHGVGARLDVKQSSGGATQLSYPPMSLRSCESENNCSLGIGVVEGTAQIVSVSATKVTVAVDLNYRVGRSHVIDVKGHYFKDEIPQDSKALSANERIVRRIDVGYGEAIHIPLPYGVDLAMCAQHHYEGEIMPDRSVCQGY